MNNDPIQVVEDNDHLGQIISGKNQEQKNVDARIHKARKCLFGLLGAGFAFKCFLSPLLKLHIYRTQVCPVLRSGLSSFSLRASNLEPLALFQRKLLNPFSSSAPVHQPQQSTSLLENYQSRVKFIRMYFHYFIVFGAILKQKFTKFWNIFCKSAPITVEPGRYI